MRQPKKSCAGARGQFGPGELASIAPTAVGRSSAGATFRVYLPVSGKAQAEEIAPRIAPAMQGNGSTVLVVEDEAQVRKLVSVVLRREGFSVLEAFDGRHALQVLEEAPSLPSLVVLDMAMPVMGGDELMPILARKYSGVKILATSGYPEEQAGYSAQQAAVAGFLQKPYTAGALVEKVREILAAGASNASRRPRPTLPGACSNWST